MSVHNSRLRFLQLQLLKNWSSRIGIGLRSISQARVNCNEEDRKNYNVWQNWVISILKETADKEKSGEIKGPFLKRPSVTVTPQEIEEAEKIVSRTIPKRRRKNMFSKSPVDEKIVWVDCEMTGLDPMNDKLMEIGIIVTDGNLNVIAEHDAIVFHIEEPMLQGMVPWCQQHHGESGLIDAARKSTVTHEAADKDLLEFLKQHTSPGECPMAGNSIGQDVAFIRFQLPKFYSHFHYRVIDVSTLKELVRRWYPKAYAAAPKKKFSHRALDDIRDSIEELKYYRSAVLRPPEADDDEVEKAAE